MVDAGANRGQFALVARRWFPKARIIAFEPLPGPASTFRKVFGSDAAAELHEHALGSEAAYKLMHVSQRDDSSSLLPITPLQVRLFPSTTEARAETVRVERLDGLLSPEDIVPPAMFKLDLQGYELRALEGAGKLLACFEYVYCECAFAGLYDGEPLADAVIAFLDSQGFRLAGVYNVGYAPEGYAVQADFLFQSRLADGRKMQADLMPAHAHISPI